MQRCWHNDMVRRFDAKAERIELSLWNDDPDQKRVYEITGEGEDIHVDLVVDSKDMASKPETNDFGP